MHIIFMATSFTYFYRPHSHPTLLAQLQAKFHTTRVRQAKESMVPDVPVEPANTQGTHALWHTCATTVSHAVVMDRPHPGVLGRSDATTKKVGAGVMRPPLPTTNETCRHARKRDISCRDHVPGTPRCLCPVLVVGFSHPRCHPGSIAFASSGVYTTRPHKAIYM